MGVRETVLSVSGGDGFLCVGVWLELECEAEVEVLEAVPRGLDVDAEGGCEHVAASGYERGDDDVGVGDFGAVAECCLLDVDEEEVEAAVGVELWDEGVVECAAGADAYAVEFVEVGVVVEAGAEEEADGYCAFLVYDVHEAVFGEE